MDERQGHVSALVYLSASMFYAIGHLRRGGKEGVGQTLTATAPPNSRASSIPIAISIERPDAHLADGPTQDAAMAKLRPRTYAVLRTKSVSYIYLGGVT